MKNKKLAHVGILASALLLIAGPALAKCYVNDQEIPCDVFFAQYGWIFVICLLIPGLLFLIKPEWLLKWQIWQTKTFMGAEYTPSKKTEMIVRIMGAILIIAALVFLYFTVVH